MKRTKRITVRFTDWQYEQLVDEAKRRQHPVAVVARQAIMRRILGPR